MNKLKRVVWRYRNKNE